MLNAKNSRIEGLLSNRFVNNLATLSQFVNKDFLTIFSAFTLSLCRTVFDLAAEAAAAAAAMPPVCVIVAAAAAAAAVAAASASMAQ